MVVNVCGMCAAANGKWALDNNLGEQRGNSGTDWKGRRAPGGIWGCRGLGDIGGGDGKYVLAAVENDSNFAFGNHFVMRYHQKRRSAKARHNGIKSSLLRISMCWAVQQ